MNYNIYPWYDNTSDAPRHYHTRDSNQTLFWSGTDQQDLFNKNLQDQEKRKYLENNNWLDSITYSFNKHGFRAEVFDDRPAGLALGCSFTEGVGLKIHQVWPSVLSNMLNMHVWNLGIGGAAFDTVFRILDYYLPKFNPKFICILMPPPNRMEYCDIHNNYCIIQAHSNINHAQFAKEWFTQEINSIQNRKKNILACQQLCDQAGIPLFTHDSIYEYPLDIRDRARDLMHYGPKVQNLIAHKFAEAYNGI